jgi:hypothetical protein
MQLHPRVRFCAVAVMIVVLAAAFAVVATSAVAPARAPGSATAAVRVVLGWSGDAATSRAVTWRTSTPVVAPRAEIGVASEAAEGPAGPVQVFAATSRTLNVGDGRLVVHHRVDFTGLRPAATYAYRVGHASSYGAWHRFTTAAAGPEPFRFVYLGDAQDGLKKKWPPLVRAALAAVPDARFVIYAGDLLNNGYDDDQWGAFFAGLGGKAAEIPGIPVPGNHDLRRSLLFDLRGRLLAVSPLWNAHFALPDNGPAELRDLAGQNYFIDSQGVRIVALDANAFSNRDFEPSQRERVRDAQLRWLRRVLDTSAPRWTVVVQHQPVYSVTKNRDFPEMRAALGAVYDQYHVDLVLQGHDHVYARSHKVAGGRLAAPGAPGTVYVVSVSGPKMYGITNTWGPLMAVLREGMQLYQIISVKGDRLSYESRTADGALVDAFSLSRAPGAGQRTPTMLSEGLSSER